MSMSLQFLNSLVIYEQQARMLLSVPIMVLSTLGVLTFLGTNLLLSNMMSSLSASLSGESSASVSTLLCLTSHTTRSCS